MQAQAATIPANRSNRIPQAIERLVKLYEAWGKPDEAAKWRKELAEHTAAERPGADSTEKP